MPMHFLLLAAIFALPFPQDRVPQTLYRTTKPTNHCYFFLKELTINSGGKIGSCVGSSGWNSEELNRLKDVIVCDRENANG